MNFVKNHAYLTTYGVTFLNSSYFKQNLVKGLLCVSFIIAQKGIDNIKIGSFALLVMTGNLILLPNKKICCILFLI